MDDKERAARRAPPKDMPRTAPKPSREALRGKPKPKDELPSQRSLTEDELAPQPAKWKRVLARIAAGVCLVLVLALSYIFLLLGEPDEEAKLAPVTAEETISMPMPAVEAPGEANLQNIAEAYGKPMLALYGSGLQMLKSRVYDDAFEGSYARRATLSYELPDGAQLNVESIRPTAAATLLSGSGYRLESGSLYTLGGLNAALMRNSESVCVFAQSETSAYAIVCPPGHDELLKQLLKQTTLVVPSEGAK